jgi:catechol 2,3-dioxygenase-like lactoylglutathione lyase family enzyme
LLSARTTVGVLSVGTAPVRMGLPPSKRDSGAKPAMSAKLNHTIVAARDRKASALFLSELLGLPAPFLLGPFAAVTVGDQLTLDFMDAGDEIHSQHYAFLVSETEFDEIFARIEQRRLPYWADPSQKKSQQINHWDDSRGVYFKDPNGHLLEILTRPYGSAGTEAQSPHPLIAERIEGKPRADATHAGKRHPACAEAPDGES